MRWQDSAIGWRGQASDDAEDSERLEPSCLEDKAVGELGNDRMEGLAEDRRGSRERKN